MKWNYCLQQFQFFTKKDSKMNIIQDQSVQTNYSQNNLYQQRPKPKYGKDRWTKQQCQQYLRCVLKEYKNLQCPIRRKKQKIFSKISLAILTRSPDQVRSHHQKMLIHHNDLNGIIEQLKYKLKLSKAQFQQLLQSLALQDKYFQFNVMNKQSQEKINIQQNVIQHEQMIQQVDSGPRRVNIIEYLMDWDQIQKQYYSQCQQYSIRQIQWFGQLLSTQII